LHDSKRTSSTRSHDKEDAVKTRGKPADSASDPGKNEVLEGWERVRLGLINGKTQKPQPITRDPQFLSVKSVCEFKKGSPNRRNGKIKKVRGIAQAVGS